MPLTTTHALLPIAVAVAFAERPVPWRLVTVAAIAAAAPDVDGIFKHLWTVPPGSIYGHRGASHSLFVALISGLITAAFHKRFGVSALATGVIVAAAMASHGALDMMTKTGQPVAYLWPLSSVRLFADWRPIPAEPVHMAHLANQASSRFWSEFQYLILPMFGIAIAVRFGRQFITNRW
jgi:inner membrane protein